MATPIPIAKPASSGTAGLIGIIFLLALLGGEYYLRTVGENSLSKAGLAAAETARKNAANKSDAQKPKNSFGADAN